MKLSIGIVVCDKDYRNLSPMLKQIVEKVTIEHEVIIVDNRERYINEPVSWTPTYQFGYNAYQFAARAKVIEHAKGEYIWFLDGDDEIVGKLNEFPWTEDIIGFSTISDPDGLVQAKDAVYTSTLSSSRMSDILQVVLWNKFIKRSLFQTQFPPIKMVSNEDALWFYSALRNAKSVRTIKNVYYHHVVGVSNKTKKVTAGDMRHLVTGYSDMRRLMREVVTDEESFHKALLILNAYLLSEMSYSDEWQAVADVCFEIMNYEDIKDAYQYGLLGDSQKGYIKKAIAASYGDEKARDLSLFQKEVLFGDGHKEMYTFNMEVEE